MSHLTHDPAVTALLEEHPDIALDAPESLIDLALALDADLAADFDSIDALIEACQALIDPAYGGQPFEWHAARYDLRFDANGQHRFGMPSARPGYFLGRPRPDNSAPHLTYDVAHARLAALVHTTKPSAQFALEELTLDWANPAIDVACVGQHLAAHVDERPARLWALRHVGCLKHTFAGLDLMSTDAVLAFLHESRSIRGGQSHGRLEVVASERVALVLQNASSTARIAFLKALGESLPEEFFGQDPWEPRQTRERLRRHGVDIEALAVSLIDDHEAEAVVLAALDEPKLRSLMITPIDAKRFEALAANRVQFVRKLVAHAPDVSAPVLAKLKPDGDAPDWLAGADDLVPALLQSELPADQLMIAMHMIATPTAKAALPGLVARIDRRCQTVAALVDSLTDLPMSIWLAALDQPNVAAVLRGLGASGRFIEFVRFDAKTRDRLRTLAPSLIWRSLLFQSHAIHDSYGEELPSLAALLFQTIPATHVAWFESEEGQQCTRLLAQVGSADALELHQRLRPDEPVRLRQTAPNSVWRTSLVAGIDDAAAVQALRFRESLDLPLAHLVWADLERAARTHDHRLRQRLLQTCALMFVAGELSWNDIVAGFEDAPAARSAMNGRDYFDDSLVHAAMAALVSLPIGKRLDLLHEVYAHPTRNRVVDLLAEQLPKDHPVRQALAHSIYNRHATAEDLPPPVLIEAVRALALPVSDGDRPDARLHADDRVVCLSGLTDHLVETVRAGLAAPKSFLENLESALRTRLVAGLKLAPDLKAALEAELGDAWPDRHSVQRALKAIQAPDGVLDRLNDEWSPRLLRAALRVWATNPDIVMGTPDATAASQVFHRFIKHYAPQPGVLARALHAELGARSTDHLPERLRAMMMALGRLRESLGGKVPRLLKQVASDESMHALVRDTAVTRKALFDRDAINKGRFQKAQRRVSGAQAVLLRSKAFVIPPAEEQQAEAG